MNDFTKDELEWLLETVDYCIEEFQEQNPAYSVQCKLKSIIDSHCEHKSTNYDDGLYYCDDCGVFVK